MNYTNREVVRRLKQYDMFLNSLELATSEVQRERICDQLDKIEKQILLETNAEYEQAYMLLLSEETSFFADEKRRLHKLITLINERRKYLEERKNNHRNITGSLVELTTFLGEDKLNVFKKRLGIIEKYEENKARQENLIKEMKVLDVKLSESSRTVKANTRLNEILENKMREIVSKALDKLNLYALTGKRNEILSAYETQEYAFNLAKDNLRTAKEIGDEKAILECDEMLSQMATEFSKYNENVNILKLIDIYDKTVSGYDELLEKRESMNEILKNLVDSSLYNEIEDELNKQYNTIKLEKQDIENYETLKKEREAKNKSLYDIEEENNSKEFKLVIEELLKNENRVRDEKIRQAKKDEYQERQKKLLEEQKIEASRVRRQKLIEEARLKEQQVRLEKVKELQDNTVINPKREDKNTDDKINNPLKDKSLDEMLSYNNSFDTDELFENTKIVPNKVLNSDNLSLEEAKDDDNVKVGEDQNITSPGDSYPTTESDIPVWEEPLDDKAVDLFKVEEPRIEEVTIKDEDATYVGKERKPSIYDILENNQNIIWKTTDTTVNKNTIPVINNNKLKSETLDSVVVDSNNMEFPKIESGKDGDILWKETL